MIFLRGRKNQVLHNLHLRTCLRLFFTRVSELLQEARNLGDALVLGLNSMHPVRSIKVQTATLE